MSMLALIAISYEVFGAVMDTAGKPVPGAAVWVEGGPGTYTLSDGSFRLNVPEGTRTIRARALGFTEASAEAYPGEPTELVLTPKAITSKEIVTVASARPVLLNETPVSVNSLSGLDMIRVGGFPRVEEALKITPSVYPVGSDPITQVVSVRGMARGRSILMLEGMRLVDDRDVGPTFFVHPGMLSSTEVLLGPSSLLYGSGAIGGVVATGFAKETRYGAVYNTVNKCPEAWAMFSSDMVGLGLWGIEAQDYMSPDTLGADTAIRNSGFRTKGAYMRLGYKGLSLEYIFAHGLNIGRPRDDPNRTATYNKDYHDLVKLGYEGVGLGLVWRAFVWGHQKFKEAEVVKFKPSTGVTTDEITRYNGADGGATVMTTGFLSSHIITGGVSGFRRQGLDISMRTVKTDSLGNITSDTTEFPTLDAGYTEVGAFILDEFPAWALRIRAGLRGDYIGWQATGEESQSRLALASEVGVLVPLPWGFEFIASGRRSYRAPELRELYYTGETPRGYQYANPDLSPEIGLTGEGGLRWSSSIFWADAELFYTHIDSMLVKDVYYDGDSIVFKNTGKAFVKGVELEAGFSLDKARFSVFGFAMEGREMAGPLDDIAPPSWASMASYEFVPCWLADSIVPWIRLRGRAAKVDPGPSEVPREAFWLLDAGLDAFFLKGNIGVNLGVQNALNAFYYDNADAKGVASPGRNISVGINGSF
ncbi:MAG: TonB-dependent receptor [candidate division WOR-3 bacterium]